MPISETDLDTSVSISGFFAIVGAPGAVLGSAYGPGAAYIFRRELQFIPPGIFVGVWTVWAKLIPYGLLTGDQFGYSVSISGDYAVVGAPFHNGSGLIDSGSAYIFETDGTNWTKSAELTASDGAAEDQFGYSVSISGGYAIVGAPYDDDNGTDSGSAYIFYRHLKYIPPNFVWVWEEQAKLVASDGNDNDFFGYSVSISGDYAIVGAPYDDDYAVESGSAYIFKRDGANWVQQCKLTAPDAGLRDRFGWSVTYDGDYAIVGAAGAGSDSAYIFRRNGTSWLHTSKLTASDRELGDYFGMCVSVSGDYVMVGAPLDDDNGHDSGSAYLFRICPTADLNNDCSVDFGDFALFADQWLQ